MCGVFGFVADGDGRPSMERLEKIARVTEQRGEHAFGFAWIDGRGRLRAYKQTGRISEHLGLLAMAADARMLIGHCRLATCGDYQNNLNNHPFACDGGWIVHNGVISNHAEILERFDVLPVTECDSETLALLIEVLDGTMAERCGRAVAEIPRHSPTVLMGLWTHPARLIVARSGNPLHWGRTTRGIYLGSLPEGLPANRQAMADGHVVEFRRQNEEVRIYGCKIKGGADGRKLDARTVHRAAAGATHKKSDGKVSQVRRGCWFE